MGNRIFVLFTILFCVSTLQATGENITTTTGSNYSLYCHVNTNISYCRFVHPLGSEIMIQPRMTNETRYEYSGVSLNNGDCAMNITDARKEDAGIWKCSVPTSTNGSSEEIAKNIQVDVNDFLTAKETSFSGSTGSSITFDYSAKGETFSYCRCAGPDGRGIVDLGENIRTGRCLVNLSSVAYSDYGAWTCSALLTTETKERSVEFTLNGNMFYNFIARATPITYIGIVLAVAIVFAVTATALYAFFKRELCFKKRGANAAQNRSNYFENSDAGLRNYFRSGKSTA